MPTAEQARSWLRRWDAQQEHYIADREERFEVIGDVVAGVAPDRPLIVDLGAGPGSLSVRLLDRFPGGRVVAVDADTLLLGLARAAHADRDGLTFVERDLRRPGWVERLREVAGGQVDAVVSTTALHWLGLQELADVYLGCAQLLRPGGVLVNGDHLGEPDDRPRLAELVVRVREARARRAGVLDREDWESWWRSIGDAPELSALTTQREPRPLDHSVPDKADEADHRRLLLEAGFAEAGTVWQFGDDRVLVGVR